ncbi:MAG: UDP-N-acetylglucosamine 2-epimerase, partial [Ignisphaera sp.]
MVIPTLNEAEAIGLVIDELRGYGFSKILVVDGRSRDGTPEIAAARGARVVTQRGEGKADAVRTALDFVDTPYMLVIDGDYSYDPSCAYRMLEEHNRRMVDHISDYLFAPTELAKRNLEEEKVLGQVYVTGNTVIDALDMYFSKVAEVEEEVLSKVKFSEYVLVTFHRAENVDDPKNLKSFIEILRKAPIPIVFPVHPRTRRRLEEWGLLTQLSSLDHVQLLPPQGYFEFIALLKNSVLALTDSGGVQEEVTHPRVRKPVLVLRNSTERPEAVSAGFARVVGLNPNVVLAELERLVS